MGRTIDKEALIRKYGGSNTEKPGQKPAGGPGGPGPGSGGPGRGMGPGGKPKNTKDSVKRLFGYLKEDKAKFALVFVFLIANTVATLAASYVLRPVINQLIDDSSASERIKTLISGLCVMAVIYVIGVIAQYMQTRLMLGISQGALQRIRDDLFRRMQKLPVRYFDTHSNGELMSRFTNDVDTVGEMLSNTVVNLLSGLITLIGTVILMFYTNWILALVTIITVPVLLKAGGAIASRSRKYYKGQQRALGAVNGYIEEMVTGQKVVKVFCHEDEAVEEFEVLSNHLQKEQMSAQFMGGIMGPVMGNMSQISYAITAIVGGVLCFLGKFDVGGLTIFTNYSRQFSRPINEISQQMNTIFSALAGAERVFEVMDQMPEKEDAKDATVICTREEYKEMEEAGAVPANVKAVDGYVKVDHVTFGYNPDKTILRDVSCYAKPGQKVAFVGSTGAGKTTVTNLINRFYDIEQGTITVDGVNIMDITKDSLRRNIAMVLQDTHLFTGTVMENIRYGRLDATDEEVIQAAKVASADSFIRRLANGYDTVIEGDGANLSQGQRQLLNIARAAVSKAPILILDEATSSVDTRTEKHIEHGMERLMASRTTFVIAHRLSTVRDSNVILVLEQGQVIERGTHEELLAMKGRYYALYTGAVELD
jgi:ATP-binding cassette subfamily B protein